MNRLQRGAVLIALADALRQRGSWCGETHIQKAAYFLQELLAVPLGFDFVLYKHAPFAFVLGDELTALQADGLLELRPQEWPAGVGLAPAPRSVPFRERYPLTLRQHGQAIEFVADFLGSKGVSELERLAMALLVTQESPDETVEARARRIHELRPHVPLDAARNAVGAVDRVIHEAQAQQAAAAVGEGKEEGVA